jgi:hypothetical protein
MMPITDQMAEIEKEFARRGYILENDYDTVSVRDNNDFVEPKQLPKYLQNLVAQYESAFLKLESFDDTALAIALQKSRATETRFMASAPKEDFTEALNEYDNLIKNPKGTTEYIKKFGLEKIKKIKDITSNFGTYITALEKSNYITKKIC